MRKLLTLAALAVVAIITFATVSAVVDNGPHALAAHTRVCIRIHHLRWCFGTRSRDTVKLARAVKAAYRADKTRSLTMQAPGPALLHGGEATFTCTQPQPGAYDCTPAP